MHSVLFMKSVLFLYLLFQFQKAVTGDSKKAAQNLKIIIFLSALNNALYS